MCGMEFANVKKLGISKGRAVEEAVMEGYPEIAETLKREHAARYAEVNGLISERTKKNLEKMLKGEIGANKGKREAALKAKEISIDEAHDLFNESSRDEARHASMLTGLLERFSK